MKLIEPDLKLDTSSIEGEEEDDDESNQELLDKMSLQKLENSKLFSPNTRVRLSIRSPVRTRNPRIIQPSREVRDNNLTPDHFFESYREYKLTA